MEEQAVSAHMVNSMKPVTLFSLGFLLTLLLSATLSAAAPSHQNVDKSGLALAGYDPLSYHQGSPKKGLEDYAVTRDGITYFFSSPANRELFLSNPDAYIPAYGGWCAWAMLEGEKVEVDPENFKIVGGRTLLFYNSFFTNTLDEWNDLTASETEEELTKKAQEHWQNVLNE